MNFLTPKISVFAFLALFVSVGGVSAQQNQRGEAFPAQSFNRINRGPEIPAALGAKLGDVARWYDKTPAELADMCQNDRSVRMDKQGRLHFVCEGLLPLQNAAAAASASSSVTVTPDASQAFLLHSNPGASKVIYLDFDGHTTTGTTWNTNFTGGADIVTPPFSNDSTVSTAFSTIELQNIVSIWQRVAEDFSPFDVDVTTQDPGVEALRKSTTSDTQFGVRVCIGGSSYTWYGAGAGGVAYLNSFTWNSDTPCFVFTDQLGSGNAKYTAEAASHEAGHTFNLSHDGQVAHDGLAAVGYYEGHANWAPIMGVGYYREVSQWSKGEYPYANNTQDDTAIISSVAGYRADQHGDVISSATALSGTSISTGGIIERRADADLFSFTTGNGPVSFTATPAVPSPNLDIQLALYDGLGTLVTYVSPTTLGATLSTTLPQGTYYLAVDGIGTGDALTAYNDYGSLGQYDLTGSITPVSGMAPVAVADDSAPLTGTAPLAVNFSSNGSYDSDGTITGFSWDFGNGSTSNSANPVYTYTVPGTYTATLVVTDNAGLSSAADTVTVVVQNNSYVYVANIAMSLSSSKQGYQATATVTVRNQNGALVPNATVTGQWSGLTTGTVSKSTGRQGTAALTSARTKSQGTFTFTVTNITISGSPYSASRNVETSDSINTP